MVVFGQKWFYSGKVVVIGQSCCNWATMVVFGQRYFSSGKVVNLGQKEMYSVKVAVFGQKWLYIEVWLYSGKVLEFLQNLL